MRDLFVALVIFGSVPYIIMRPHIGVYVWALLSYMNPHRLTWGFAFSFPFNQLIAGVTIISFLFSREPKRFPWSATSVVWLAFVLWTCVTTVMAIDPAHSVGEWDRFMKIQLMILFTLLLVNDRERIQWLVWVIVVSIGFYGVKGGIFTILTGGQSLVWGPPYSFIAGNNEIAFAMSITLPLMYYLFSVSSRKFVRWGLVGAMGLNVAAILGTYSRGAFLTLAAIGFMLILKSRKKVPILLLACVAAVAVVSLMPEKYVERINTIRNYEEDGSAMGRINAWGFAINLANDRPMVGGGFMTFREELFPRYAPEPDNFHDAHSIYFEVLGEQGYVGLVLFLTLGAMTFFSCTGMIRRTRGRPDLKWAGDLAAMLQASLAGYAVGGAFLGLAYWDFVYHLMAITVLLQKVLQDELHKAPADAREGGDPPAAGRAPLNPLGYSNKPTLSGYGGK